MNLKTAKRNAMLTILVDVKKTIWMSLTGMVLSCPAIAASFDCTKAQTSVETLICADAALSKLDEEMANVYRDVLAYVIDPATLRIEQEQWLKVRNKSIDKEPLSQQYHERIFTLRTEKTITKNEPRYRYMLERGEDKALCPHMTQVFNDKFKTPWYKSWLKLESDPILFGLPYSKQFERLPGVAYDKHSTFDMLLVKYPTSPEFLRLWFSILAVVQCPSG